MSWRRWKRGLFVSTLTGLATGLVGVNAGLSLKGAALFLVATTAKDLLLFLSQNPVDKLSDQTTVFVKKTDV